MSAPSLGFMLSMLRFELMVVETAQLPRDGLEETNRRINRAMAVTRAVNVAQALARTLEGEDRKALAEVARLVSIVSRAEDDKLAIAEALRAFEGALARFPDVSLL